MASGLPDVDDFLSTYGGAKVNFAPVEDPTTDEDANVRNLYAMNVAMMTATVPRSIIRFTGAATTGGLVLVSHQSLWGNSAPVAPTFSRTSAGLYVATLPTTVTDALGVAHTINIRAVTMNVRGSGVAWDYYAQPASASTVNIYTFNATGAATDATGVDIDLMVY